MKELQKRWETLRTKVDELSLRERAMMFAAMASMLISLVNALFLDPLLAKQEAMAKQVMLQQQKMNEQQTARQMLLTAQREDKNSPLRTRISQLQADLQAQGLYLKSRSDRLVQPDQITHLLEQVLSKQKEVQLVSLETLPIAPLLEKSAASDNAPPVDPQQQIFKHGVKLTIRGSYLAVLRYLTALENMPTQMFWGDIRFRVDKYPNAEVSLTLFTLSMGNIWLKV